MTSDLPFSVIVDQFATLRAQANDEWHASKAIAAGPALALTLDELMRAEEMAEKSPLTRALRSFLKKLPDAQVNALVALMYSGRDSEPDPVEYWRSYLRKVVQTRGVAVDALLEKEPAAEYVRRGIVNLPAGMELDSLPTLVGRGE